MFVEPSVNTRKLIQYYPLYYRSGTGEWEEAPHPVVEEMIWTGKEWMSWTGDYRKYSSNTVKPSGVICEWPLSAISI